MDNHKKRVMISFTLRGDIGVEKKGNIIILFPLAHICVATHTDGQESIRRDLMRLFYY